VAVIGAGIAGITAGVLLPIKVPGIQLTIFDKNSDVVRKTPETSISQPPNASI
jgi:L-2-hydroxyglutarate oxidase LhgO